MTVEWGNLFAGLPTDVAREDIATLFATPHTRIERIVSHGQASPPGFWYDQGWSEWVVVLHGRAAVQIEGEAAPRQLQAGDYLLLPAHLRHRVEWTDEQEPTVWLAVHAG